MAPMVAKGPPPTPLAPTPQVRAEEAARAAHPSSSAAVGSVADSQEPKRQWATGATIVAFLIVGGALGAAPELPDWARPVDLSSLESAEAIVSRVVAKPKMTLASMDETDEQRDEALVADAAKDIDGNTTDEATAEDTSKDSDSLTFINIDDDQKKPEASQDRRQRTEPKVSKKTAILRRIARKLKAPGTTVENPCVKHGPNGCLKTALDPFFVALDAVADDVSGSQATVVTLGNSLIASDHVTDRVRARLVREFGDGGRGYLLPDRLSKLAGRRVRTGRGTSGWDIHTFAQKKPGRRGFGFAGSMHESSRRNDRIKWKFNRANSAKIFWLDHPKSPGFRVEVDGKVVHRESASKKKSKSEWQTFSDGGYGRDRTLDIEIPEGAKSLSVVAKGKGVVLYGAAIEGDQSGVTFDTIGVPASDASMYLKVDPEIYARQLKARDPSMFILMLGGNETRSLSFGWMTPDEARDNYAQLIDRTKEALPDAACLAVAPIDAAKATAAGAKLVTRPENLVVVDIEREVALEKGCAFLNLHEAMGGKGSLQRFHREGLVNADLVHPTGRGGDVIGTLMADALLDSYRTTPAPQEKIEVKRRLVRPRLYGLNFPGDDKQGTGPRSPLARLYDKFASLERNMGAGSRLAVGQFGASHVAAQYFTDHLRERLAFRFGQAGRGWVPAGPAAPEYLPGRVTRRVIGPHVVENGRNVVLGGAMNPAGTALRMEPGARFDVTFCDGCDDASRTRGTLDLTWLQTPNMGTADVYVNDVWLGTIGAKSSFPNLSRAGYGVESSSSDVMRLRIPVRGAAHSLSIQVRKKGERGRAGKGDSPSAVRKRDPSADQGPVILFGVAQETKDSGVVVDALGLPGSTGMTMQRWRQDVVASQVRHRAYDLLVFAWGTNEASLTKLDAKTYRHHLTKTVTTLMNASPGADCIFLTGSESFRRKGKKGQRKLVRAPNIALVDRVQKEVAAKMGCAYFDTKRAMGGPGALKKWVKKGLAQKDYIHLTPEGYRKLADAFVHDVMAQMQYARAKEEQTRQNLAAAKAKATSDKDEGNGAAPKGGDDDTGAAKAEDGAGGPKKNAGAKK